jgi:hypothetical protein
LGLLVKDFAASGSQVGRFVKYFDRIVAHWIRARLANGQFDRGIEQPVEERRGSDLEPGRCDRAHRVADKNGDGLRQVLLAELLRV